MGDATVDVLEQGDGPPLLFCHGEDGLLFARPLLDDLATGFRVIAPHAPGWGDSSRPRHVTDVRDIAALFLEIVEGLDEPPLVVGCSFGAWVAAELAILARERIAGLVLVAPIGIKLADRETRDFADIYMVSFDELRGILYAGDRAPDLTELPDEDYLYLARAQEAATRFCWQPYMYDPKLRHWLRRISVPATVVAGDADTFVLSPDYYAGYAALVGTAGAALEVVAGAGHRLEEEEPATLARIIRDHASAAQRDTAGSLAVAKGR